MAELGQTTDPRALVPGDPSAINQAAAEWRERATAAGSVADRLRSVPVPDGWTGEAADGFAARRDKAADAWDKLAPMASAAGDAIESYATTLGWAQQKAGDAISMWETAEARTAESLSIKARQERMAGPGDILPPYVDGGAALRADAQDLLAYAREEAATAAAAAANALRSAAGVAPPAPDPWLVATALAGGLVQVQLRQHWNVLADIVNATASVGNALIRHPETLLAILGGAGMIAGGGAMMGGGGLATATGVGAPAGAPTAIAGAGLATAGVAAAGAGALAAAGFASADSRVEIMQRQPGRDDGGRFNGDGSRPWVDKEKQGLDSVEKDLAAPVVRDRVRADVPGGNPNGRFFDGFIKNDDGTYIAIEVKSGTATRTPAQRLFDEIINSGTPATAQLNGETIRIVGVILKEVP